MSRLKERLTDDKTAGLLLLAAAGIALFWANSRWAGSYHRLIATAFGPDLLHLHLTTTQWFGDGLLALFFFVAGLELRHEMKHGALSDRRTVALPVFAAVGGMLVPALIYLAVAAHQPGAAEGWGIPMATDIAFALTALAVLGRRLPRQARAFLLTLAVVDDLGAITVIAVFYTDRVGYGSLLISVGLIALYGVLVQRRRVPAWLLVVIGFAAWDFMHTSGVHATVAGVALGLLTPDRGQPPSLAERMQPWTNGVCLPLFALVTAGVPLAGGGDRLLHDPIAWGIVLGLVVGKPLGIFSGAALAARFAGGRLTGDMDWPTVLRIGAVGGIGFTVSLLITELALPARDLPTAKLAVLIASALSALVFAVLATAVPRRRPAR